MSDCDAGYCQYDSLVCDLAESGQRIADLERQLSEAKGEIARLKERLEIGFGFDLDGNRISISENLPDGIDCRDETIKMLDKSIAAMRPMVEACRARHEHHLVFNQEGDAFVCHCLTCQWYRDYLERKQS